MIQKGNGREKILFRIALAQSHRKCEDSRYFNYVGTGWKIHTIAVLFYTTWVLCNEKRANDPNVTVDRRVKKGGGLKGL